MSSDIFMDTVCSCFFYIYLLTCTFFQISMLFHPSMLYLRWSPSRTSCRGQTYCQRSAPWKATKWRSHGRTEPITCGRAYVSWRARSARSIPIQPIRDDHIPFCFIIFLDAPNSYSPIKSRLFVAVDMCGCICDPPHYPVLFPAPPPPS